MGRSRHIGLSAIRGAAGAIYDVVVRTPLVRLTLPSGSSDPPTPAIYLKLECLQPIGSFKIRGAWNVVRQLPREAVADGLWTVSAGNAAQGVALSARFAGVPCSVMVMDTAPETKLRALAQLGATVVRAPYDECWETVERHSSARMRGRFVHPFDDDEFIAGNGTAGLEILEDLPDVDSVVMSVGGGGLLAGVGSAIKALRQDVRIVAAEPETAAPVAASLARGEASAFDNWTASFVDGAGGRSVLPTMWPLISALVTDSVVVSLDEIRAAMRLVADRVHVIAEGAAACAVAAALSGRVPGHRIAVIISGGNIDLSRFAELVGACDESKS